MGELLRKSVETDHGGLGLCAETADMLIEQRVEPREALALPVTLGSGQAAVTRDISASGMYIELGGRHELGGPVVFEMDLTDARIRFVAEGEIVRIDHSDDKTGVAVRLLSARLQSLP